MSDTKNNNSLSKNQQEKALKWLNEKWKKDASCEVCGEKKLAVGRGYGVATNYEWQQYKPWRKFLSISFFSLQKLCQHEIFQCCCDGFSRWREKRGGKE